MNPGIKYLDKCSCLKTSPRLLGSPRERHRFRLRQIRVMNKCQGLLKMPPAGPLRHLAASRGAWAGHGLLSGARQELEATSGFTDTAVYGNTQNRE